MVKNAGNVGVGIGELVTVADGVTRAKGGIAAEFDSIG